MRYKMPNAKVRDISYWAIFFLLLFSKFAFYFMFSNGRSFIGKLMYIYCHPNRTVLVFLRCFRT